MKPEVIKAWNAWRRRRAVLINNERTCLQNAREARSLADKTPRLHHYFLNRSSAWVEAARVWRDRRLEYRRRRPYLPPDRKIPQTRYQLSVCMSARLLQRVDESAARNGRTREGEISALVQSALKGKKR